MSYPYKYENGQDIQIGDIVTCKKWTTRTYKDGKPVDTPVLGEVVKAVQFTKFPTGGICVVFHQESTWGFHTFVSSHLPRKNGGFNYAKSEDLNLLSRKREGESIFDPPPYEERVRTYRRE